MSNVATAVSEESVPAAQASKPITEARRFARQADIGAISSNAEPVIKSILVPTDFSPASAKAVARAVGLANQCEAAVTILHVIDVNTPTETGSATELMGRLWEQGSADMGRLAWSLGGQVQVRTVVEEGLAWDAIVQWSCDFDLLILGLRRKPRHGLFCQHTSERVIEKANCPVMIVHD